MEYSDLSRDQLIEALEEIEVELEEVEEERNELEEKAMKIKADFENYRKKQDERKQNWQETAEKKLATDLIQVIDNMERALATADEDSSVYEGVKMVADQLYETLEKKGLESIDAEGEEFDPKLHRAVETQEHDEDNKVLEQRRKGYMFNDTVLREAEVVVGKNDEENDISDN
ncbi:MAG: nucleotide exchange factor GrpE [Candidatus Nanohaloarchaea archaeon]